ncbi:MAG: SCP2 sterol-binding domain-containing protein [Firmicutes bacterium]|nr:SCP2 sterol-binding domain-containing protein [[Eubacterium] siraeum]MCM1487751.1 SCP2 sterol-binding domain-containing protein [Bacillota bacterium]
MTYEEIFKQVKKNFEKTNAKNLKREFAFQFNITGEGEGIFYAAFKDGVLSIEPYDYKDRDVIFTADGRTLIDISAGKTEPIDAIERGRLAVEGNELSNQLMMLIPAAKKSAAKKTDAKPAAKKEAKTAPKKAAPKKETKPAAKASTPKAAAKPAAAKPEAKPAAKVEAKPAPKAEAKPAAKAEVKAAPKAEAKPAAKAEASAPAKPEAKPAAKTEAKSDKK